jgi:hypothetical protein
MNRRMSAVAAGGDSTVTPPAATSEAVAAGGSPGGKTFGAYTDADSIINSYTSTVRSAVGSTSASGSGLGGYTYSGHANGDSFVHYLDAKDSSGDIVATAVHVVDVAGAAATFTTIAEVNFTTDITDLALVKGGGDTTLYEADGSTAKAVVGYLDGTGTSTSTCVISGANGGAKITSGGTADGADMYVRFTASGDGFDFTDHSRIYKVDAVFSGITLSVNNNTLGVWISRDPDFRSYDGTANFQHYRKTSGSYPVRGLRRFGGQTAGADQPGTPPTSARTTASVTFMISRGRISHAFFTESSSYQSGYPTASGTVFESDMGTDAVAMEAGMDLFAANLYVGFEIYTSSGTQDVAVLQKVRVQEINL